MKTSFTLIMLLITAGLFAQNIAPVNPDYIDYQQKKAAGTWQMVTSEGYGLGEVPAMHLPTFLPEKPNTNPPKFAALYDLRTENWVSSVKNQGSYGTCWAHAAAGALESNWMKNGLAENNLSESNIATCHGFTQDGVNAGGNNQMAGTYFMRLSGPISESDDAYSRLASNQNCVSGLTPVAYQTEMRYLPPYNSNAIKQAILDHGGVYSNYYHNDTYYNSSSKTYYYSGSNGTNHAILLVGWDDNKVTAGGTGAWIAKNSWSTGWGESGYFYIAYQDSKINSSPAYFSNRIDYNADATLYHYDELGSISAFGYPDETDYALIKFTANGNQQITKLATWIESEETEVEFKVYDDFNGSTLSNQLGSISNQVTGYPGYYTFDLSTPIDIADGNDFYIWVKYYTPGTNYSIPIEYVGGYANPSIQSGVCWCSNNGTTSWSALGTGTGSEYDLCIRAYASPVQTYDVTFHVTDGSVPLKFASVTMNGDTKATDNGGYATFTGLTNNTYWYLVELTGYNDNTGNVIVNGQNETVDVILTSDATYNVTFMVYDEDSNPLENAEVEFNGESQNTGTNGEAVFTYVSPGTHPYSVTLMGYVQQGDDVVVIDDDVLQNIYLKQAPLYTITFNVTENGDPLQGVDVVFNGETIETGSDGKAIFYFVEIGLREYWINKTGYNTETGFVDVDGNKTIDVSMMLIPTYSVTFYVSDGTNPVENANVNFNATNQLTNSSGSTTFTDIIAGDNQPYIVSKTGYANTNGTINVVDDDVTENVMLNIITYNIYFTVNDGTNPIVNAEVICDGVTQYTGQYGTTTFTGKTNGTYNYSVNKSGYHSENSTVVVNNGNTNKTVSLNLITYTVEFTVSDGTNPINGATVNFNGSNKNTNSSGIATFTNVAPGSGKPFSVTKTGYYQYNNTVNVVDQDVDVPVTMTIIPTYSVTFNVSDGTNPIEGADVTFNGTNKNTDGLGFASFNNVAPGTDLAYTVTKAGYYQVNNTIDVVDEDVEVPVVMTIIPTFSVTFNVSDGTNSLEGATITFNGGSQLTNALGSTTFSGVEVGNGKVYTVTFAGYSDTYGIVDVVDEDVFEGVVMSESISTYNVIFWIRDDFTSASIEGASVIFNGTSLNTGSTGRVTFEAVVEGTELPYSVNMQGFHTITGFVDVVDQDVYVNKKMIDERIATQLILSGSPTTFSATFSWDGIGAEKYKLVYNEEGTTNYISKYVNSSPYTITGLEPDKNYVCRIRSSIDGVYTSYDYSNSISFTTAAGENPIATNLHVVGSPGVTSVTLDWDGSGATYYILNYYETGTSNYNIVRITSGPIDLYGLTPGTNYTCKIRTYFGGIFYPYLPAITFTTNSTKEAVIQNNAFSQIDNLIVYPNPANSFVNVEFSSTKDGNCSIKVVDLSGKVLAFFQDYIYSGSNSIKLEVSELSSGLYLLLLQQENQIQQVKLIVE